MCSFNFRREWEPGIRVRRKLMQKENSEITTSSLIRSRSNSHSGKKEPKSGEGNGSVVQDSGFSTETSSSKETHSASSTSGGTVHSTQTINPLNRLPLNDAEDELWNLLDVIHRKSTRLREEVEYLQSIEKEQSRTNSIPPSFLNQLERLTKDDVQILRKERDQLLDKIAEMEAETITNRIRAANAEQKLDFMTLAKQKIEEELKIALSQKVELNTRIHDMHQQYVTSSSVSPSHTTFQTVPLPTPRSLSSSSSSSPSTIATSAFVTTSTTSASSVVATATTTTSPNYRSSFQPVTHKTSLSGTIAAVAATTITSSPSSNGFIDSCNLNDSKLNLGRLDGVVSSPNRCIKVRVADSKKIAAILLETNPIELQRHLLTVTFQNQVSDSFFLNFILFCYVTNLLPF